MIQLLPEGVGATDLAWAAGLFDGEGCVLAQEKRGAIYTTLRVENTDKRLLDKFQQVVGGFVRQLPARRGHRPTYFWAVSGDVSSVVARWLLLYSGGDKRDQLEAYVELRKLIRYGGRYTPQEKAERERLVAFIRSAKRRLADDSSGSEEPPAHKTP